MKKIVKKLLCLLILLDVLFLFGCSSTYEKSVTKELKRKYGEEFVVLGTKKGSYGSGRYSVLASPKNKSEVIFEVEMIGNKMYDDNSDNYPAQYAAGLIIENLQDDLQQFFPDALFHANVRLSGGNKIKTVKGKTLDDIFNVADADTSEMTLYIYYDKDKGTACKFEEEYNYFTNTIDQYISEKKAVPITVCIIKVDSEALKRLEEFYRFDIEINASDEEYLYGIDDFECGIWGNGDADIGNPPNIAANFNDNFGYIVVENKEEYIRRREVLENE
ncbi:MAG: hypothetical protein K5654_07685 [Lachnospiraceae bacterium]|nr:hypothetical protein [Lachnospiraceae bacterium]